MLLAPLLYGRGALDRGVGESAASAAWQDRFRGDRPDTATAYYVARNALDVLVLLDPEGPGPSPALRCALDGGPATKQFAPLCVRPSRSFSACLARCPCISESLGLLRSFTNVECRLPRSAAASVSMITRLRGLCAGGVAGDRVAGELGSRWGWRAARPLLPGSYVFLAGRGPAGRETRFTGGDPWDAGSATAPRPRPLPVRPTTGPSSP